MGRTITNANDCGFTVISHTKRITGKCPMCETEFDVLFDLKQGETQYTCPCGYFYLNAESEDVNEDNHNVPKEEWKRRLAKSRGIMIEVKCNACNTTKMVEDTGSDLIAMPLHGKPGHMGACIGSGGLAYKTGKIQRKD
jgi:hypothetical protein